MKNYIPKLILLLISAMLGMMLLSTRSQLGQGNAQRPAKANLRKFLTRNSALPPVAQFGQAQAEAAQEQTRRQSRQRLSQGLYSGKPIVDPGTRDVNGQSETLDLTFVDGVKILKPGERKDPDGLPINDAVIVIGTVLSGNAYISQEHTGVFTEYGVSVSEVLKPDPNATISPADQITTWRPGGSLQFPSGHIKHFIIKGRGFPEVGTQYVFFLRRADKDVNDYAIAAAFSLKDEVVSPLDDAQDLSAFDGVSVNDFLNRLRKEISARQGGGLDQ